MSKVALVGLSFGGTLAHRAASREHRISAVMAIDGILNLVETLDHELPPSLIELCRSGSKTSFDEVMNSIAVNSTYPSSLRQLIDQGVWSFHTDFAYDRYTGLGDIAMDPEVVSNLPMPVFVAKGQDDTLTRQQPEIANQRLVTGRKNGETLTTFHEFETSLVAGEHCSLGAEPQ